MAKPTYYPLWATDDTTLPATDNTNKERPKETLRTTGWDKGQIPSAEEFNWMLNNIYLWIQYFNAEAFDLYVPIAGTSVTLTGDVEGTGSFSDGLSMTIETEVNASVNTSTGSLVRRGSNGNIYGNNVVAQPLSSSSTEAFTATRTGDGYIIGGISASQTEGGTSGWVTLRRVTPSTQAVPSIITLYDAGYITLTAPRSSSGQETTGEALVRYDTLTSQISSVNSSISSLNSSLQSTNNNVNNIIANYVQNVRLGGSSSYKERELTERLSGGVMTSWADYGDSNYWVLLRPLQININGTWYTVSYV